MNQKAIWCRFLVKKDMVENGGETLKAMGKRTVALVLMLMLVFSLAACGNSESKQYEQAMGLYKDGKYDDALEIFEKLEDYEDSEDMAEACKVKADPIKYLEKYLEKNGATDDDGNGEYTYVMDTDLEKVNLGIIYKDEDVLNLLLIYRPVEAGGYDVTYNTVFHLLGDTAGEIYQANLVKTSSGSTISGLAVDCKVDLAKLTPDTDPEIVDVETSSSSQEVTGPAKATIRDGYNILLEEFAELIKEVNPELTLADFGLTAYKIDADRESAIRSGE